MQDVIDTLEVGKEVRLSLRDYRKINGHAECLEARPDGKRDPLDRDGSKTFYIIKRAKADPPKVEAPELEEHPILWTSLARDKLRQTDFVNQLAFERSRKPSAAWLEWRQKLREIVNTNEGPIPDEPERWGADEAVDPVAPLVDLKSRIDEVRNGHPTHPTEPEGMPQPFGVPPEIAPLIREGESYADARKRLTEELNLELGDLKNKRASGAGNKVDLDREAEIETLLGVFARWGEG